VPTVYQRLRRIVDGHWYTTSAPTETQRRSLEIAEGQMDELAAELRELVDVDLRQLEEDIEAAGAPYTPGRSVQ